MSAGEKREIHRFVHWAALTVALLYGYFVSYVCFFTNFCEFLRNRTVHTVHLTSIDYLQIGGAYISGLRASNFSFFLFASGPLVSGGPDATIGFA